MQSAIQSSIILLQEDYNLLTNYFKTTRPPVQVHEKQAGRSLKEELDSAIIVSKENLPPGVVRLQSSVVIKELETNRVLTVMLVMPGKADIRKNKISVLAPLGTALLGFRKNQIITWPVPGGVKSFLIMEVF